MWQKIRKWTNGTIPPQTVDGRPRSRPCPALRLLGKISVRRFAMMGMVVALATSCDGVDTKGRETVPTLIEKLSSPSPLIRSRAATSLGEMGSLAAPAVPQLIALLGDWSSTGTNDPSVCHSAKKALQRIGEPAVTPCIAALKTSSGGRRHSLVLTLGGFSDPRAVDAVIQMFDDSDALFRVSAIESVFGNGDPRIVPHLIKSLKDTEPDVRSAAIRSLGKAADPRAAGPLITMLDDKDISVRTYAARELGKFRDPRISHVLMKVFSDSRESPNLRGTAAQAMGECGDVGALEALSRVLRDQSNPESVRCGAAWGLGLLRKSGFADPLRSVLADCSDSPSVRWVVVSVIAKYDASEAVALLSPVALATKDNARVRFWAAIEVIRAKGGAIDDPNILVEGLRGYEDPNATRTEVGEAVEQLKNVLEMVVSRGGNEAVRAAARERLRARFGKNGDPGDQSLGK